MECLANAIAVFLYNCDEVKTEYDSIESFAKELTKYLYLDYYRRSIADSLRKVIHNCNSDDKAREAAQLLREVVAL